MTMTGLWIGKTLLELCCEARYFTFHPLNTITVDSFHLKQIPCCKGEKRYFTVTNKLWKGYCCFYGMLRKGVSWTHSSSTLPRQDDNDCVNFLWWHFGLRKCSSCVMWSAGPFRQGSLHMVLHSNAGLWTVGKGTNFCLPVGQNPWAALKRSLP